MASDPRFVVRGAVLDVAGAGDDDGGGSAGAGESKATDGRASATAAGEAASASAADAGFACRYKSDCPRFAVDLDAPAESRWDHIIEVYKDLLPGVLDMVEDVVGTGWQESMVTGFMKLLTKAGGVMYGNELKGISRAAGVPLGRVTLLQIAYEAFAACTSIVVPGDVAGTPLHIRTMDWESDALKDLTFICDFQTGGKTVYTATTWAGYVGVLTGMRPGGWSASVNYRRTEDFGLKGFLKNMWAGLTSSWPVGFLIRVCLAEDATYEAAVGSLSASSLMAPVYVTLAGTSDGEGCVLSRGRSDEAGERLTLFGAASKSGGSGSSESKHGGGRLPRVVQVNMDHWRGDEEESDWQDICQSRDRRDLAHAYLDRIEGHPTLDDLWDLTRIPPVLAHDQVYTVSMVPKTGQMVAQVAATRADVRAAAKRRPPRSSMRAYAGSGATRQ